MFVFVLVFGFEITIHGGSCDEFMIPMVCNAIHYFRVKVLLGAFGYLSTLKGGICSAS